MRYNIVHTSEGHSTIVLIDKDGKARSITETHPHYIRIADGLVHHKDISEWLDDSRKIVVALSARVSLVNDVLHFDGDPIVNGLASTIQRYHAEGRDATNLIRFMERLANNPSENSREQLFNWSQSVSLTIDRDGYLIGYKGVTARTDDKDFVGPNGEARFGLSRYPYKSVTAGHGIVDGHDITGNLPMGVGVVVEMPRDEVQDNPNQGCSVGLHVGTYDYAKGYASRGALFEVRFDPADVVSVPNDCNFAKLRCCRYEVVDIHEAQDDDLSAHEPEATSDFDEDAAMDAFVNYVPKGWLARLKDRRKNRKSEVEA